ncbi:ATP-binding protein [Desulfosarcina sp.]|uniref:sensor histidine kinase n=1 Tax=Desulfosarcina sp. TaxID=2027861 RepID=UPI003970B50B
MADRKPYGGCDVLNFQIEDPYFKALCDAPIPVLIVGDDGRLLMINRAFQTATGFSHAAIPTIGAWAGHIFNDSPEKHENFFNRLFEPEKVLESLRISLKRTDGQALIWELSKALLGRMTDGRRIAVIVASDITHAAEHERHLESMMNCLEEEVSNRTKDLNTTISALEKEISERKRIGDALTLSRERLKNISRRALDVLEADRRTVSKELHDSIGASLAAIKFSLEEKEMKREQNQGRLAESLNQEITYLLATIKETKRISANLRPTTMDDLGLMATIEWYLRQFKRFYRKINVDYRTDITESDIPEAMKIIIYRIIQEGLSNAEKHSDADRVRLQMGFTDGNRSISLLIQDDGRGFDVKEVFSPKDPLSGYGLTSMRERCEIFGGSFHIESHLGQGTKINAILPI